ncbi:hypothetical protein NDI76_12475 [Halogeometricum sp. S1BR25-6]|uniref:C2H2-type domain-containing protein n=1 Tax=Halogeometricum salsisoli TaxID=2950536 RepID=A0ABU2GHB6_9EURY|nr:hypothetical protein [Halogeometricum sp. S1BR25-6]MDS0299559.1 hypothetical protein [Halogeometricum sp. S1BR25-6]
MTEPTETAKATESEREPGSERKCPACGDRFEDGTAYRDHLFSVGLVY